ncbi:MAG: pyridoxal-phosphate-dependent aminotransferase family protein, partial [Streptosporangiaceae bacterium]
MTYHSGRHFLQVPGPTNVPDRILRAMAAPTIDHRGAEFAGLARQVLAGAGRLCGTTRPVALYPSSGTGAWEAALVNTLSPGDRVLAFDTGHFATLWTRMAGKLGLDVDIVPGDWRRGVDPDQVLACLSADAAHQIKAVTIVQNETSTGAASPIRLIRAAMDSARHPALLIVDAISSLGSVEYQHDEWGVDVTIWCSQKGMMLPPGLGLNAVSEKALEASRRARLPRSYWEWQPMLDVAATGLFPYTPATNLLFGLREALAMFDGEGPQAVFARHAR